jgi:drug/metabolite transporter (DMT)-like permease
MPDRTPEPDFADCSGSTSEEKRREILIAAYCLGWGLCFVGASYLIKHEIVTARPLVWVVAILPSLAAVWMVRAYTRYLRQTDELQRQIQLQAMGWGFGGGFFGICGYGLFVPLGAPAIHAETIATVMPLLFAVGMFVGWWRYR